MVGSDDGRDKENRTPGTQPKGDNSRGEGQENKGQGKRDDHREQKQENAEVELDDDSQKRLIELGWKKMGSGFEECFRKEVKRWLTVPPIIAPSWILADFALYLFMTKEGFYLTSFDVYSEEFFGESIEEVLEDLEISFGPEVVARLS